MRSTRRLVLFVFAALAVARTLNASASEDGPDAIPLSNWAVPPTPDGMAPPPAGTLGDWGSQALLFVPVTPCRIIDTRGTAGVPYGGPKMTAGVARDFDLNSAPSGCTGIPPNAVAYSLNLTVTQTEGSGFLAAYPKGNQPSPLVSTLNFVANDTVANAAVVPCDGAGVVTLLLGSANAHVIADINGYFTWYLNSGVGLLVDALVSGTGAIRGVNYSNGASSSGVAGEAWGSGSTFGVLGTVGASAAYGSAGVKGLGLFDSGSGRRTWGVLGAVGNLAWPNVHTGLTYTGGVLGMGKRWGVLGLSESDGSGSAPGPYTYTASGVEGCESYSGITANCGALGYSLSNNVAYIQYAVWGNGDIGASGTKYFVEPHPSDPGKVIRYVALEGPEAGTYFRGRARTAGGRATIEVPEDFRLVTDEEGLTVQTTPIGAISAMGVLSADLRAIVVGSEKDVEFSYLVQGVRKSFRHIEPIGENLEFRPRSADARMPSNFSGEQKRRLVASGVYNPDGTVNMETAERLGWTRAWASEAASR